DRIDTHDRSADKLLNQVYVVNHQIEHDAHIAAALLERREPMRLDEARCFELPHCGDDGRIEALQVPDLQHATTSLRGRDQLLRFRDGGCDRFLDEHMNAVLEQLAADPMMQWRGHSQAHCVHSPDELTVIHKRLDAELRGDLRGGVRVRVDDRHELRVRQLRVLLCVEATEVTDANDGST